MNKNKNSGGRPTKWHPKYVSEIIAFFDVPKNKQYVKSERTTRKSNGTEQTYREYAYIAEDLPTLDKFARKIKVNGDTLVEWAKEGNKKKYSGFYEAYKIAKVLQKEFLIDNALKGLYPPATFIFIAKNITDMKDKVEADVTSVGRHIAGFTMVAPQIPQKLDDKT